MVKNFKFALVLMLCFSITFVGLSQIRYTPKEVHMTFDYSNISGASSLNGPAFGVSWLMQNRFMNTFDFAVGRNKLQDNSYNRNVTLRYQVMYVPDIGLGKLKTGIGIGVDRSMGREINSMNLNMLGKIKYPFYNAYFVELIVPYSLYYNNYGKFSPNSGDTKYRTYKGINLETKRISTVRVGIGVSF